MARILLIEDSEAERRMTKLLLERAGHDVIEAENGRDGLVKLGFGSFDLVVTDVIMPEQDGVEVIREVRSRKPGLKVLAISGGDDRIPAQISLKMMEMYNADVMYKPFDNDTLLAKVDALVGG